MEVFIKTSGKLIRVGIMKEFGDLEHIVDSLQALGILYLQTKRSEQSKGFDALQLSANSDPESNSSPHDEIPNSEGLEKSLEIYNEKATGKKTLLRLDGQVVTGNMAASIVTIASRNGPVRSPATLIEGLENHRRVGIRVINEQAARNQMRTLVNTGFLDEEGNLTRNGAYVAEVVKELDDDLSEVPSGIKAPPF